MRLLFSIILQILALAFAYIGTPVCLTFAGMCAMGVIWLRTRYYIRRPGAREEAV